LLPAEITAGHTFEQAVHGLTDTAFPGDSAMAQAAFKQLVNSAESYPVELAAGTVLVHARHGDLNRPLIMVCYSPEGCPLPGIPVPPKIILVLLGGQFLSPAQHLKTLSFLAKRMHEPEVEQAVHAVHSAAEICTLLGQNAPSLFNP
jgi:mannitol/fructose-specific phosphotransferase system IIA component (Ntr-type)